MLSVVILALAAVSVSAYYPKPELQKLWLAKWNPRNMFELEKICELSYEKSYLKSPYIGVYDYEDTYDIYTKDRREDYKIRHCCNKASLYEKKECLKDVRENVLDHYCTKSRDHICCKKDYETRYTCFARYPFGSLDERFNTWPLTTSPLYDTVDRLGDYDCGRTCRQRRRADRYLKRRLGVEGEYDTDYVTDLVDDDEVSTVVGGGVYSYLDDVEDYGRLYDRPDLYTIGGRLEREMIDEVEDTLYDKVKGRRLMAKEIKAEGIAEVLAEDEYETPYLRGTPVDTLRKLTEIEDIERMRPLTDIDDIEKIRKYAELETGLYVDPLRTDYRLERLLEDRDYDVEFDWMKRPCDESPRCRRKIHVATDAGARRVCTDKIFKSTPKQLESCCKSGVLVGKTAGRKNSNVCLPALYKFAAKTRGCVYDKHICKKTFVDCCRETAELVRKDRTYEKVLYREDPLELEEEVLDDVVSRRIPFY